MRGWRRTGVAMMAAAALGIAGLGAVANAQAPGAPAPPAPLPGLPGAGATALTGKIAYVDVQRVIARASAGVAAREQIERVRSSRSFARRSRRRARS